MVSDNEKKAGTPTTAKARPTTYPGKNDGRISAAKNAGMRSGASLPGPKKK
jgi:hypothetical protein